MPRRLEPDPLDAADGLIEADRVALAKGFVEEDGERREQVGENALRGKADGDAADSEARDQRGDVDPEIVENDDDRQREQCDADEDPDDRGRIAQGGFRGSVADPPGDQGEDQLARPDRSLQGEGDREADVDQPLRPRAEAGHRSRRCRSPP